MTVFLLIATMFLSLAPHGGQRITKWEIINLQLCKVEIIGTKKCILECKPRILPKKKQPK